tara:strand:+ start:62 stop:520 length:459 start_codon:yes stop_codon:yes gene_type:complete
MRKITKESAKAFVNFKPYKKDNTEVVIDHLNDPLGKDAKFYLHGYCIVLSGGNGVYRNIDLCGYHTRTTRERINGVLDAWGYDFRIAQRNHEQVLVRRRRRWRFKPNGENSESYVQDILKLSDDSFDPDFAERVFNSKEFVSGTDLNAITDF